MTFTISVEHHPELLVVKGAGPASLTDLCGFMDLVGETAAQHGYKRALLDLLEVHIAFSFTDHFAFGAHSAQQLRLLDRVASAVAAAYRVGTSEKAAQKMGLQLRTFTDLAHARAWVLES
jgi:hypothetical protein